MPLTTTERAALHSIRESFDRFGLSLEHITDEELKAAVERLSYTVAHAGISTSQALDAIKKLNHALR